MLNSFFGKSLIFVVAQLDDINIFFVFFVKITSKYYFISKIIGEPVDRVTGLVGIEC